MGISRLEILLRPVILAGLSIGISLQSASAEATALQSIAESPPSLPIEPEPDPLQRYLEAYASGSYSEAADAAAILINNVIAQGGDDLMYADALERLARAQYMTGETSASIGNYRDAIERIQSAQDMLATRLIAPLTGLARSLQQGGEFLEAATTYNRAAHISRVNEGPMNLTQSAILSELINLYASQARYAQASDIQAYQLEIYRRSLDATDPKVLDAWRRKGEMLSLAGYHRQAQEHYVAAMDIIRVADGRDSLAQVPLLNDLSASYLSHAKAESFTRIEMAREQLQRAVSITESNAASTNLQLSAVHLRMGDFMQRFGDWKSALGSYRKAWGQLSETSSLRELRNTEFNAPTVLNLPAAGPALTSLAVTVTYNVNSRGQVDDARAEEDPANDSAARRALTLARKLVFRPRFDDGDPVGTPDLVRQVLVRQ